MFEHFEVRFLERETGVNTKIEVGLSTFVLFAPPRDVFFEVGKIPRALALYLTGSRQQTFPGNYYRQALVILFASSSNNGSLLC